ncbi:4'-phosphopantetheinyl transferase sfp [Pirellulimonas nuda]|uniref:4'-phosphopantetheinyl transferase sfp n=1 Tax=Pirellulimonas nuda TaxID=2528009 RepID=A0A518D6V9_9BACT|nr:4'-phosphopantetheinyl transferase superfamily protein [Pirellulimonas nuda]QDU87222.1 4'-phosphopantetheinyl transferase sfp [Pirellulimonas nuda]
MTDPPAIRVWYWRTCDPCTAAQWSLLDGAETAWAHRLVRDVSRTRYVASHVGLRTRLAELTGERPEALRFSTGPQGKPSLVGGGNPSFNLAHSGDWAALAVSTLGELGVDLEVFRKVRDARAIARRYFAPSEHAAIEVDEPDTPFLRVWTRKEAVVKLIGTGLLQPLTSFAVPTSAEPAEWIDLPQPNPIAEPRCWVAALRAPQGCLAALATARAPASVTIEEA